MLWGSAYGGVVLGLAVRRHLPVPEKGYDELLKYLSAQLRQSAPAPATDPPEDRCLALFALAVGRRAEPAYHELMFKQRAQLSAQGRVWLALAILESEGPRELVEELLHNQAAARPAYENCFSNEASEQAARLLAWARYRPTDKAVDLLARELLQNVQRGHWGSTQGNAWALLALTDYATRVEGQLYSVEGALRYGSQQEHFQLAGRSAVFERVFPLSPALATTPLVLDNPGGRLLFCQTTLEARPTVKTQPPQAHGFTIQRAYARLDDNNAPQPASSLRVGDRVLVTLALRANAEAHYVVVDDPLPAVCEAIQPEFVSEQTRGAGQLTTDWISSHRELRADRAVFFSDYLPAGRYAIRYLARVRAVGTATAPPVRIEEMYHPDRFGLSDTVVLTARPWQ
jgi:uncharacterized protein YfaS (alpha-2-macroglobulin family)